MKRILTLVFLVFSFISWGQDTTKYINQDQQIKYQNKQWFVDSIIVTGLYGNGTIVKIDENGYLYKDFGTQDTLVDTSQVVNLNKYLNLKQNIVYGGDSITVRNDSIFWNGVAVNGVTGLIDSLNAKQDNLIAGSYISFSADTINVTNIPVTYITGALDSINTRQRTLTAGTGITISNDTISSTATGSDGDWTINGNYVYNLSDSIGIGVSNPSMALDVAGRVNITNINTGLTVTNTGASSALNLVSNVAGNALTINSGVIDSLSNDATLSGNDANDIVSEQAIKGYVDNAIENNTRVSWGADVDTSARVDGFVLKWNNGTKKHYYDTAGTGGGGGSYFAGAGLELSASKFSIGADSINRTMIGDTMVSYAKIQNLTANTVLARGEATDGVVQEISLSSNQLLGRGSSGNITAISLSGLSMSGNTLTNTNTGTVTNIASGNGMNFSSITTTGTVTLGTPSTTTVSSTNSLTSNSHTHQLDLSGRTLTAGNGLTGGGTLGADRTFTLGTPTTLTGTTTNTVTSTSHTHALDFSTFPNNIRTFYFDTARVIGDDVPLIGGKMPITNQEKVIAFTMSTEADNVLLGNGYYTIEGMVDIEIINDDTTSGINGFFQNYQLNVYVTDDAQFLAKTLTGTTTVIETAEANATPMSLTDADGNPLDGTVRLHLVTTPIKFYLTDGQFVALTIKATYPSPADFVSQKRATMRVTRAVDYDSTKEQLPDITAP